MEQLEKDQLLKNWRKHSGDMRRSVGVSSEFAGWSQRPDKRLIGLPRLPRLVDVLDVAWGSRLMQAAPSETASSLAKDFWCNVSQAVQRTPWLFNGGCLTPQAVWYAFERDVVLDGRDFFAIQGLPKNVKTAGLSDSNLRDLGGDSYSCPVIATGVLALYFQPFAQWWPKGAHT